MKFLKFLLVLLVFPHLFAAEITPKQIIIKTDAELQSKTSFQNNKINQMLAEYSVHNIETILPQLGNYYLIEVADKIDWEKLQNSKPAIIESMQPNYLNEMLLSPNDEMYGEQLSYFQSINLPAAWNYSTGNGEISIGIVDSGIHFDHPDLTENIFINTNEIPYNGIDDDGNGYVDDWRGWDFTDAPELDYMASGDYIEQDNDPTDEYNHGTHVAGIIAADTNNKIGVSGVSWNNKILPVRAGFKTADGVSGYLQDDDAAAGIIYCAEMGMDIINCSWGSSEYSQIIADACQYAYEKGSIIVVSSGNTGQSGVWYPARLSSTIAVGAVDSYNQVAIFSTYGPQIDLVAPGVNILSTYNNEAENLYSAQSGTSMAAPIVSSAISLLLSVNSDLNFEEIKTYLANSCQKIGDDNFTNLYGNGLLDVHKLLTNQNNMVLEITSPKDNSYIDNDVEIRGTAIASNFWRYSVAYTTSNNPSSLDWNDVETHLNTPKYYYTPVENGVLAHFETPNIEESYTIRLDLVTSDNKHHYYMQTVNIDKTPPELNHAYYMKRYKAEMPQYFVQTVFDDVVNIKMEIETESETYSVKNNYPDSIMVQKLPSNINSGEAKINVFAKNLSAMENSWQEIVNFNIDSQSIDFNTFSSQYLDNELKLVNNTIDFNEDSIAEEFLATEISGASQTNRIYELQNDELSTLYSFHDIFYPLDITHSWQNDEILALGISNNQGVVYRVFQREKGYSDSLFWNTNQVYGGAFIDFDMDGKDELALIKNKTINNVTKRVIELYDENFEEVEYLLNNTPTTVRNEFIALKCADLNNDGNVEILTADKDGDVMIFTNAEEGFELTWHTKLPVENCYYLDINDYNGNGTLEFCAGGFTQNELDQNKTFSYFAVFTLGNNGYEMLDYISFAEVIEKNSLTSGDLDADGDAELIFAATPNIYIADFFENKLQPMWQNSVNSIENNSILCLPASRRILVNDGLVGDYHSVLIKPQNFNGPATPHNFTVVPLDENKVKLEWQNSASSKIYRKYKENINLIAETSTNSFVDSTFSSLNSFSIEDSLYYRVTTVDDEMEPAESLPTPWKIAIPNYVPSLNKIEMNSANELLVEFDTPLANSALNCGNYEVNNNIGRPVSINSVAQQKGLLMRFANHFEQINNYSLHIDILQGRTGVTQTDLNFNFQYKEDVIGPYITGVEIKDDAVVKIYFNESLNQESVADTSNFKMVMPSIDSHNKLVNTQYIENSGEYVILLHMYKQLEYSNQAYFVKLENIEDITGNVIQNDGNKTHFRLTDIVDLNHLIIYPNPFNTNKYEHISFANLPLEKSGKIWIYELDGNLIFKDEIGELSQLENVYRWDGRNNSGKKISSGLYIFVLNIDDKYKRGKIAIIN